jgi:hypothetical protein
MLCYVMASFLPPWSQPARPDMPIHDRRATDPDARKYVDMITIHTGGGACGTCYDFFINHLTSTTLATALLD